MSALLEITEKLQDTQAAIVRLENAAANNPDSTSIHLSLGSLQKRQRDLEAQLAEIIAVEHINAYSYRLMPEQTQYQRPTLFALTKALCQAWVTEMFYRNAQPLKGMIPATDKEVLSIILHKEPAQRDSHIRIEESEMEHQRRKNLLLSGSALVVIGIALGLCVWAIVKEGSSASDKTWGLTFLTAIVTGFVGYVTGRATK